MYWESNQQQFKFSPCSGQQAKEVEEEKGQHQHWSSPILRWKEESLTQSA